jgi:hypothetical protein
MKTLFIILIILAILIAIFLVTALFVRKRYAVERDVVIDKPRQVVFDYIKLLRNQNNFSKWASMDAAMKQEFRGTDGTVGFVSAWDSDKKEVGKGEQTILRIVEGERVEFELHFIKPFEGRAIAYMTTEAVSDHQTKVRWGFTSSMHYPMNIMLLFMDMEKMIGNDFSIGLTNLKKVLEKP